MKKKNDSLVIDRTGSKDRLLQQQIPKKEIDVDVGEELAKDRYRNVNSSGEAEKTVTEEEEPVRP
ncbi:hypothetical protein HanIR_Chr12g0566321 [Helianthus annuus]|nr:hypothetical protein HanIR_Chr12g0566321 [Helianthus annuus]